MNGWDLQALATVAGAIAVVSFGIYTNGLRFFTIREHAAYQRAQEIAWVALDKRLEDILDRVKALEHTRPTTGELKAWVTSKINGETAE